MNVKQIRKQNALELAASVGGTTKFALKVGVDPSQASQFLGPNAKRNIGDNVAAKIEKAFGKESGWLDRPHGAGTSQPDAVAPGENEALLLQCLRAVRAEIKALDLNLTEEDADELLVRATIVLYKFSQANHGELLPASAAIAAARL